jgi:BCD family chlorophyll transporter-like MFS transporter
MKGLNQKLAGTWTKVGTQFLPFADAATAELPLGRLLRLSLFQVSVGMALVLLNGTLNRVMIVELGVPTWLVAMMVALPLVFAPFRALIGFKSDNHRSVLGWKRVPYIWIGTLLQFGGFAIMPFALLVLSGDGFGPVVFGQIGAGLAFLLVGAGLHTTQTAGLALATDLAPEAARPRVVALLYVMLLLGMVASALTFGYLLADFSNLRLIKVIQGAAVITMALNVVALWKQEARDPSRTRRDAPKPAFSESWQAFIGGGQSRRLLVSLGLGTAAFSMQDILLEPYGGQIMHMAVGATTTLTALMAIGSLCAFALAARWLNGGIDPHRLAAMGAPSLSRPVSIFCPLTILLTMP